MVPVTPFAAHQVQNAQNQQAAALLFTPHAISRPSHAVSCSPLGRSRLRPVSPSPASSLVSPLASGGSDSDSTGDELNVGLEKLNLTATARPGSSKSPRAGPHSKQQAASSKRGGGATDIWTFFEKSDTYHSCIFCK